MEIIISPVFVLDADGLPRLDVRFIVVAGTLCHGYTGVFFIQVETLRAGAAVHRQEVRGAALLIGAQRSAGQLASLMFVGEGLSCRAAP